VAALLLMVGCLIATGCGSSAPGVTRESVSALHRQKIKRRALERKLARVRKEVRREEGVRAAAVADIPERNGESLFAPGAPESFRALAESISGLVGLAVAPLGGSGRTETFGSLRSGHAWSTIKVPILVTLMREGNLSAQEQEWAIAALEISDNEAAASLFGRLEDAHGGLAGASSAVQEVLAAAGDTETVVATAPPPPGAVSTYGQTQWSLEGSTAFYRSLANGCLLDSGGTEYVLGLMREVIPEQRWGLGEARFDPHWRVAMKGGWGPESDSGAYLVRQAGVVEDGASGVAVAMIAEADSGSFEAGTSNLTRIASWLRENLRHLGPPARGC
jgi:hypothetical protein